MKSSALCLVCLSAAVVAAAAVGRGPTESRWGADGVRSMYAIGAICLAAAVLGAAPLMLVARRWPAYMGQAVLGGTALRLLLTMAAAGAYQVAARPHLPSFLFWAVVFYLLLLVIETAFGVAAVRRHYRPVHGPGGLTT